MESETNTKQPKQPDNGLLTSLPPSLSVSFTGVYNGLNDLNKGVFIRVFNYLWRYLFNYRELFRRGVVHYWCLDVVRLRSGLTTSELSSLSYLYQVTRQGVNMVHSDYLYNSVIFQDLQYKSKQGVLNDLKHKGFVSRHTLDPSAPYLRRCHSRQPVFIKLTSKGVQCIEQIEKDLYRLLLNTSLNDLTGVSNKKP